MYQSCGWECGWDCWEEITLVYFEFAWLFLEFLKFISTARPLVYWERSDGPCVMYVCTRFYAPRKDHTLRTSASVDIRELKQTTTMKATRTSLNRSFNELSKTVAVHVRYKSSYISMPSSAKQQREITKFCVVYGTGTTTANFSYFYLNLNAVVANLA